MTFKGILRWKPSLLQQWLITTVIALLTLIATIVGVVVANMQPNQGKDDPDPAPTWTASSANTTGQDVPSSKASTTDQLGDDPGGNPSSTCFNGTEVASCQAEHTAELVTGLKTCSKSELIRFMGGRDDVDILGEWLTIRPEEAGCLIEGISSSTEQSLARIFSTSYGDSYRICWDSATKTSVSCNKLHDGELIYAGETEELDCKARYKTYVGRSYTSDDLELTLIDDPKTNTCWVEPRSTRLLKSSLRNLKSNVLPWAD